MIRTRDDPVFRRFAKRKEALQKMAKELATRCGVDVAVFCADPDAPDGIGLAWPSKKAVREVTGRFNAFPLEERARHVEDHADHLARRLDDERKKLVRAKEGDVACPLKSWDSPLEDMAKEELRELLASIDVSLAAARSRALDRQPQNGGTLDRARVLPGSVEADEATAETSASVRASGASNGARRLLGDVDAGGGVSGLPLEENPAEAPNATHPLVTAEHPVSAAAPDAGNEEPAGGDNSMVLELDHLLEDMEEFLRTPNELQLLLEEFLRTPNELQLLLEEFPGAPNAGPLDLEADNAVAGQDESDEVQILQQQPTDDAEWMRDLVETLEKIPAPSNAIPNCWETEYVSLGPGYAIERDAYDFIRFDLGIPPPCIAPDSQDSDEDEPLTLWSWQ